MIIELQITNLILIELAVIPFEKGLNVISGETGSGKSAIMAALQLLTGERADAGIVRNGALKGVVEASVVIPPKEELLQALEEMQIEFTSAEPLVMRREISSSGKSRALINDHAVTLGQLKFIGAYLIEIVGQHANQMLFSTDQHRSILDLYGDSTPLAARFQNSWIKENSVRKALQEMVQNEGARLREIERIEFEIEEIDTANLKDGEEEELFTEYTLLSNAEERVQKAREANNGLSGEKTGLLNALRRQKTLLEQLEKLDPSVAETCRLHQSALMELEEVSYLLNQYETRIDANPERLQPVDERLKLISQLKKKYGGSTSKVLEYLSIIKQRLVDLENSDHKIEALKEELAKIEGENDQLAAELSHFRKCAAMLLAKAMQTELAALNMPTAIFEVELSAQPRGVHGDEKVEFFLFPNVGEKRIPIKDCASGGELSRIMLALQTLLADKTSIPILIFDEIDANVGGTTANIVGEKLQNIGRNHQVLCITHFPQVAQYASHHLHIYKSEIDGRTVTQVRSLDKKGRIKELERMRGK